MFRACVHIHSFLFLQYSPTNASVGVLSSIPSSSVLLIYSLFSASFAEVCATSAMPSRWWRRAVSSPSPCSLRLCRSSSLFLRRVSLRFSWRSFRCALSSGVSFGSRRRRDRDRDLDLDLDLRRPLLLFRLLRVSSRCFSFAFCSGVPSFSIFAWRSARVFFPKKAASILEAAFFSDSVAFELSSENRSLWKLAFCLKADHLALFFSRRYSATPLISLPMTKA